MSGTISIENAEQLYHTEQYELAFDMCTSLLRSDAERDSRLYSLTARSFLQSMDTPPDDSSKKTLYKVFCSAYSNARTPAEALKVKYELAEAVVGWTNRVLPAAIEHLLQNPRKNIDHLRTGLLPPSYQMTYCEATLLAQLDGKSPHYEKISAEDTAAAEQLYGKLAKMPSDLEMQTLVLDGARRLFSGTLKKLSENNAGSPDFMLAVCDVIDGELFIASWMADTCIPNGFGKKEEDYSPRFIFDSLNLKAKILQARLDATVFPNGSPFSVVQSVETRQNLLRELRQTYEKLRQVYPDFTAPELPSEQPRNNSSSGARSNSSSGGCYVATAVYGSYDCPQVWTLRRFRDDTLAKSWYGRAFIRAYYAVSPALVKWFGQTAWFKALWRGKLDRMVENLQASGVESTPYQDKSW